jgi:hypothetical protein
MYVCMYCRYIQRYSIKDTNYAFNVKRKVDVSINWKLSEGITVPFIQVAYFKAHTVHRPNSMTSDALMAITFHAE